MSALEEIEKLILNSKFISEKDKEDFRKKIKKENHPSDFLKGFKNEKTNDKK
jgi:hypothetical protein